MVSTYLNNSKNWPKGGAFLLQETQHFFGIVNDFSVLRKKNNRVISLFTVREDKHNGYPDKACYPK